jgi:hypothetical protein
MQTGENLSQILFRPFTNIGAKNKRFFELKLLVLTEFHTVLLCTNIAVT